MRLSNLRAVLIFVLLGLNRLRATPIPDKVMRKIRREEKLVSELAKEISRLFKQRAKYLSFCECQHHACTNKNISFECTDIVGPNKPVCGKKCDKRRISFEEPAFRLPPGTDPDHMSAHLKESICLYGNLKEPMQKLIPKKKANWLTFGTIHGSMHIYPFRPLQRGLEDGDRKLNGCMKYDPRIRPWFIAASTRPKDIVFVIDSSTSMLKVVKEGSEDTRWDVTTRSVAAMLRTMTSSDYVNIVTFSDSAKRLGEESSLLKGTYENLEFLRDQINDEYPVGLTNFEAAFEEAFNILINACDEDAEVPHCSNCQKVILFLTDGRDTTGPDHESIEATAILSKIETYQKTLEKATKKRASIFTFSMGGSSDDSIPRQIACANGGSWSFIDSDTDPLSAMSGYYRFLTNLDSDDSPVWVDPYIDAGGQGCVANVAKPVFSSGVRKLDGIFLGVVSHTVLLNELEIPGWSYQYILEVYKNNTVCGALPQNLCQLQVQRNAHSNDALCVDNISFKSTKYANASSKKESACYRNESHYYKLFFNKVNWYQARRKCEKDGGHLTTIHSFDELAFVAGVGSPDGSWIGAHRTDRNSPWKWIDEKQKAENLIKSLEYWGNGEPNNHKEKDENCVEIDRRGARGNLNDENCDTLLSFVCEYNSAKQCEEVIEVPEKGFFSMPPLSECVHEEESWIHAQPLKNSYKLKREDVMCDFGGLIKTSRQMICCEDCQSEEEEGLDFHLEDPTTCQR
eukprot:g7093.t1